MIPQKITIVNDGQTVDKDFVFDWDILDYCDQYNGKITISFVGVVIKADRVLFSFPKHYDVPVFESEQQSCIKQILYILSKSKATYGSFEKGLKGEFPLQAYFGVLGYYKKYGLYLSNENYLINGYEGNIDWNKTINQSNRVIQKGGIIFFPFVIKTSRDKSVFISECMNYVLNDASKYREFISSILPYESINDNKALNNFKYVIAQLKQLRNVYFKDIEKKLINSLIEYFDWKSKAKDSVRLLTLRFENYWEVMINEYLNDKFVDIKDDKIIWGKSGNTKFHKPEMEYVESKSIRMNAKKRVLYQIQYDHISINDEAKQIVIFDSKYFNDEVSQLNYKQLFYHYNLLQQYPDYNINNGLLLPTAFGYYTKVHVDRSDLDGIKIIEHYINLNEVLNHYANKL